jgi:hypothetical protein
MADTQVIAHPYTFRNLEKGGIMGLFGEWDWIFRNRQLSKVKKREHTSFEKVSSVRWNTTASRYISQNELCFTL